MDTSIAMSGAQPNFLAIKQYANEAAQSQINNNQANALAGYVKQNGAGIMNGDPNALAGYAQFDPAGALGIQNTQQSMAFDAEEMAMKRTAVAQQTAETLAANKTAADIAEVEAAHDKLQGTLTGAFQFYQAGNEQGYNDFLQQNGLDPAQYPFNNFPAIAAQVDGTLDGMKTWKDTFGAPDAPEWRAATPEEAAQFGATGGQISTKTGKFDPNPKGAANAEWVDIPQQEALAMGFPFAQRNKVTGEVKGTKPAASTKIESDGKGGMIITQGAGGNAASTSAALGENALSAETIVASIDEIFNDPALGKITGTVEGGGGNDVGEFNVMQRMYYGSDGLNLIEKVNQLQNTTFLAARQLLKGGGAITDFESKKAEAAMARLSRVKNEKDFKAALQDLKDAVSEGEKKLRDAGASGATATPPAPTPGQPVVIGGYTIEAVE